jgi:hypothetical protein
MLAAWAAKFDHLQSVLAAGYVSKISLHLERGNEIRQLLTLAEASRMAGVRHIESDQAPANTGVDHVAYDPNGVHRTAPMRDLGQ